MAWTEDLLIRTDDRLEPNPITLSGDDRTGDVITLSRGIDWSLPLADVDEVRRLGEWLIAQADEVIDALCEADR